MGFKLAEGYVELKQQGFESVAAATAKVKAEMTGAMGVAQRFAGALQTGIGTLGNQLATNFAGNVQQSIVGLVRASAAAEDTAIGFEVLLGSADKAQKMLGQLRALASTSPLGFGDTTGAAETMLQFGVAENKILPILRQLGDVSGGNSQRFRSLALVYGQVSSAAKLQGQDLLQLVNAGFNPLQEISRTTGESMASLRQKMEQGRISVQMLDDALRSTTSAGGRHEGMLEKRGAGLTGTLSQLADQSTVVQTALGNILVRGSGLKQVAKDVEQSSGGVAAWLQKNELALAYHVRALGALAGIDVFRQIASSASKALGVGGVADEADKATKSVNLTADSLRILRDRLAELQEMRSAGTIDEKGFREGAAEAMKGAGLGEINKPDAIIAQERRLQEIARLKGLLNGADRTISESPIALPLVQQERDNLAAQIGELTGSTKMLADARERLAKANAMLKASTPEQAEIEFRLGQMKNLDHATPEDIARGRDILEQAAAAEKAAKAKFTGETFIAELTREVGVLSKTITPVDAQMMKLKRDGMNDPKMLGGIQALLKAKEELERSTKNQSMFHGWTDEIDVAKRKIDDIDVQLRQMARNKASLEDLKTAADLLIEKRKVEGKSPSFSSFDQLNKNMQSMVGNPSERNAAAEKRVAEALAAANRDGKGNPLLGGVGGALSALLDKAGGFNPARLLGGAAGAGAGPGRGDPQLQRVGDLLDRAAETLDNIRSALVDAGIKVKEIPRQGLVA